MSTLVRLIAALSLLHVVAAHAADSELFGRWIINAELSHEAQPTGPKQSTWMSKLPQTSVSVGGMPLPSTGPDALPSAPGSARDPRVLRCSELRIEPQGDDLQLGYDVGSDTLKRGEDQGLVSRWGRRKLTTRYETSSRKVSQVYEVRRDGRLLVTVKLNPNDGPAIVYKRVFDRAEEALGSP